MGQLHELTGHLEKAVSSYRRYLSEYGKKVISFMRQFKLWQCQIRLYCTSRLDFGIVDVGNKKLLLLCRSNKTLKSAFEIHLKDEQNSGVSSFCITIIIIIS